MYGPSPEGVQQTCLPLGADVGRYATIVYDATDGGVVTGKRKSSKKFRIFNEKMVYVEVLGCSKI